ncbi:MAG TPA: HTTM domain-containing protein [Polyangiaceae bacterium]
MGTSQPDTWWSRVIATLSRPCDGASLAVFRICFGLLLAYEISFKFRANKVDELHASHLSFKYPLFEWVPDASESMAYGLHYALIGLGLLIAAGAFYRVTTALTFLLLSYYFLAERTLFINHIYLYCLLAGILALVPAHNMLSVDQHFGWLGTRPRAQGRTPAWSIWLLRFQMGVVYTYAGLAKLNADWLQGCPLSIWLPERLGRDHALWFDALPLIMSWGGVAFDLSITPLLLHPRTRTFGFLWAAAFHVTNAMIFGIASFPWMSLALTLLFFTPDWPRRQWPSLQGVPRKPQSPRKLGKLGFASLCGYVLLQLLLPMRPWFYPGNASWTEEGHEFSWHMMLRAKSGQLKITTVDSHGRRVRVDPLQYVTRRQLSRVEGRPDMIHQLALFVADEHERQHGERPKVFVDVQVAWNGRPLEPLIDPSVDLAAEPRSLAPAKWLLPAPTTPPHRGP